ncbi:hypothetical protein, partial [Shewanella sp.]|uniref:hypothetical protein n=1 Tax=Shewanella sp. TaxID=50422 RepID=UPI003F67BD48
MKLLNLGLNSVSVLALTDKNQDDICPTYGDFFWTAWLQACRVTAKKSLWLLVFGNRVVEHDHRSIKSSMKLRHSLTCVLLALGILPSANAFAADTLNRQGYYR